MWLLHARQKYVINKTSIGDKIYNNIRYIVMMGYLDPSLIRLAGLVFLEDSLLKDP